MDPIRELEHAQERVLARYAVNAESHYVDVAAIEGRAHVLVAGSGPPVVMVPGLGDPAAIWAPLMAELSGFTLHAVGRPCFGLSDPMVHETSSLRRRAVDFLEGVLDALDLTNPAFIASSVGSLWTFWLALDRPERVLSMTHLGCPALVLHTSAPLPLRLLSIPPVGRAIMSLFPPSSQNVERFALAVGGEDLSDLPEIRDLLVAGQRMRHAGESTIALLHAMLRLRGARRRLSLRQNELRQVRQPTQLLWGDHDPFGSTRVAERVARSLVDAELHVLRDAGHLPWLPHARQAADLLTPFIRREQLVGHSRRPSSVKPSPLH